MDDLVMVRPPARPVPPPNEFSTLFSLVLQKHRDRVGASNPRPSPRDRPLLSLTRRRPRED